MAHDYRAEPLDGPNAAGANHRVVFENDHVRVLETTIPVGQTAPVHTHLVPHVMIVESGTHFVRRDPGGGVMLDTRAIPGFALGRVAWSDGVPAHTLENTGDDDIHVFAVELKEQAR